MNIEQVIHAHRVLKARKADLELEYKNKLQPIQTKIDQLENALLGLMQTTGCESFKTSEGTAYKSERVRISCADKGAFMDYIRQNDAYELLEVRPSKAAVEEYAAGTGIFPPGLNRTAELVVNVRKS
jgi:hypothetical protein